MLRAFRLSGATDNRLSEVGCLVRPFTRHLEAQGGPTWYARFRAQVMDARP